MKEKDTMFNNCCCELLVGSLLLGCLAAGLAGLRRFLEAVLGATLHTPQMAHAASAFGAATLGLGAPVILAHRRSRVRARSATRLLDVIRTLSAATAQSVSLVVATAKRAGSLCHSFLFLLSIEKRTIANNSKVAQAIKNISFF
jgi:hypothetical protein